MGSYIPLGNRMSDEMSQSMQKAQLSPIKMKHSWRWRDILLSRKGDMYTGAKIGPDMQNLTCIIVGLSDDLVIRWGTVTDCSVLASFGRG